MNKSVALWIAVGLAGAGLGAACSAGQNDGFGGGDADGTGGTSSSQVVSSSESSTGTGFGEQSSGMGMPGCDSGPNDDQDMDGYTFMQGDCNDCDANVNPAAIEVIADDGMGGGGGMMEPADEDCDGLIDNIPMPCDTGIAMDTSDPLDGAAAIELCHPATPQADWGVVSAQWVRANGTPATVNLHMGVLPDLGPNVPTRQGASMLAISSGAARDATDPGYCGGLSCSYNGAGVAPPGFPQDVPGCSGGSNINDDVGLELTLKAPTNATGYQFDFRFYSNEYPEWVCTTFNDQFISLVNPAPMDSINGNISFDSMNNPVSVNVAFFDVCQGCPAGTMELIGTGFSEAEGGTSWLQTTAPIGGGETFTIRYAIWDTGDTALDSTTLIDNFKWIANGGTVNVGTNPVPD